MEAISNHARNAAKNREERKYNTNELARLANVTLGAAFLASTPEGETCILIATDATHVEEQYKYENEDTWQRPRNMDEDTFVLGIKLSFERYEITGHEAMNGAVFSGDGSPDPNTIIGMGGTLTTADNPDATMHLSTMAITSFPWTRIHETTNGNYIRNTDAE